MAPSLCRLLFRWLSVIVGLHAVFRTCFRLILTMSEESSPWVVTPKSGLWYRSKIVRSISHCNQQPGPLEHDGQRLHTDSNLGRHSTAVDTMQVLGIRGLVGGTDQESPTRQCVFFSRCKTFFTARSSDGMHLEPGQYVVYEGGGTAQLLDEQRVSLRDEQALACRRQSSSVV